MSVLQAVEEKQKDSIGTLAAGMDLPRNPMLYGRDKDECVHPFLYVICYYPFFSLTQTEHFVEDVPPSHIIGTATAP